MAQQIQEWFFLHKMYYNRMWKNVNLLFKKKFIFLHTDSSDWDFVFFRFFSVK